MYPIIYAVITGLLIIALIFFSVIDYSASNPFLVQSSTHQVYTEYPTAHIVYIITSVCLILLCCILGLTAITRKTRPILSTLLLTLAIVLIGTLTIDYLYPDIFHRLLRQTIFRHAQPTLFGPSGVSAVRYNKTN